MAYVVRMPKLGVEMETGVVTDWHVDLSDPVEEDQVIAEIESEKTAAEVAARETGLLQRVYMEAGDEGPPGAPMGIVAGPHEDVESLAAEVDADPVAGGSTDDDGASDPAGTGDTADADRADAGSGGAGAGPETTGDAATGDDGAIAGAASDGSAVEDGHPAGSGAGGNGAGEGTAGADAAGDLAPRTPEGRIKATPKARKRAEELGVALSGIPGSGPEGAIVADDVEAAGGPATGGDAAAGEGERTVLEERSLTPMRRTIADRLGRSSREIPHVTVDREVDVEAALAAADRADAAAEADVAVTDVVLAAVSATLSEYPAFNATYDAEAERHTLYAEHNVGVAVDVDGGLVTPVLPDLRDRGPAGIAAARSRLVDRVLAGEYDAEDLSGGTFTVSNLGAVGSDSFTPIVNPPEVAILGVNRIRERPVNTEAGIEFRDHVTFSLSFDHRVVDGADAARFLATLDEHLADAGSLVADR